jgi:hypothetical protein
MIMRITWGKLHPGKWNEFERTYKEAVAAHGKQIKGLLGRGCHAIALIRIAALR